MKRSLFIIIGLVISYPAFSQACLPEGLYLVNQNQVDSFQINYPNCTYILGEVVIGAYYDSDISDLSGLSPIYDIDGDLIIGDYFYGGNHLLASLYGLNNLNHIGGDLSIGFNPALINLNGLNNLTSVEGSLIVESNDSLINFSGLENLNYIGGYLWILENPKLISLAGLESLNSIGSDLEIYKNFNLTSIVALENLSTLGGYIEIYKNNLTSLSGLDNLEAATITNLYIAFNPYLSDCATKTICEYLANPIGDISIHDNRNGCNSQFEVETICDVSIDEDYMTQRNFSIYPNPANISITIDITSSNYISQLTILNLNGKVLKQSPLMHSRTHFDISSLQAGLYIVKISNENDITILKLLKY